MGLAARLGIVAGCAVTLAWLIEEVQEREPQDIDRAPDLHAWTSGAGSVTLHIVGAGSSIGSGPIYLGLVTALIGLLLWHRRRADAAFAAVCLAIAPIVDRSLKSALHRPRPADMIRGVFLPKPLSAALLLTGLTAVVLIAPRSRRVALAAWFGVIAVLATAYDAGVGAAIALQRGGDAFPSGHATSTATLATVVVYLAWRTRWRKLAVIAAILYVGVVGASRVLLDYHENTDVLGGWCIAVLITAMVATARSIIERTGPWAGSADDCDEGRPAMNRA